MLMILDLIDKTQTPVFWPKQQHRQNCNFDYLTIYQRKIFKSPSPHLNSLGVVGYEHLLLRVALPETVTFQLRLWRVEEGSIALFLVLLVQSTTAAKKTHFLEFSESNKKQN